MAVSSGTAVFYTVLIAPGFIAVMIGISLSAMEQSLSQFVLLIWSLVTSLFIDIAFLWSYQVIYGPITSLNELTGILFNPSLKLDYLLIVFLTSVAVGGLYALGFLTDVPGRFRKTLQRNSYVTYNPRQPWENFMRDAKNIRIKTQDDQLYAGDVSEWSRAGRRREVRIENPHRYQPKISDYESVGRDDMLFLGGDIDRVLMREKDEMVQKGEDDE
ncbi:DUF6338 family protein [Halogeometricum luteum]|uniref:DUF6338 family protein n=1 Tax=Halogeometricum luteum TaxID=2950537 RepID=A0ABU2G779_9EURY|nr:DUF6338 family protein [Halogeometricum sp. S3BR5-2]MDS0296655.1 DUF6338 family protein [Halogeometricum sp. S3BR5-2]